MTASDHGVLFRLSDREHVRLQIESLGELQRQLAGAPGGREGSPSAGSAHDTIGHAIERSDEVRHFELSDAEETEILWALTRTMDGGRELPPDLLSLRHHLADIATRE